MSKDRKRIAVIFGGESVEHDVSILTGLQFLEAMDLEKYQGLPVYVAPDGGWWTGEALRRRSFYPLTEAGKKDLRAVRLGGGARRGDRPSLRAEKGGLFGAREQHIPYDLMVPAIHGSNGEDGSLQGLLAFYGLPFAGCRTLAASVTMDKAFTKTVLGALGVPVLPHALIERPGPDAGGLDPAAVEAAIETALGTDPFPLFIKPVGLGSSVAAAAAADRESLLAALMAVFRFDPIAMVEPRIPNLMEYNVAATRATGELRLSAIERPEREADFLDFGEKYLAGGSPGAKLDEAPSEGLVSQSRVLDPPELSPEQASAISRHARLAFEALDLAGSVRIDFLCDGQTGKLWLNEINTVPGSFAYYLWQGATPPLSFMDLASALIEEGFRLSARERNSTDAEAGRAVIFDRG